MSYDQCKGLWGIAMQKSRITVVFTLCLLAIATAFENDAVAGEAAPSPGQAAALRAAVEDLTATFGKRYPHGARFLKQLESPPERQAA